MEAGSPPYLRSKGSCVDQGLTYTAMTTGKRIIVVAALFGLFSAALEAQWINYPTPGIPRLPDGRPNLSAPTPRTQDGKPDLSGIWVTRRGGPNWLANLGAGGVEIPMRPVALALWRERQENNGKDRPSGRCISHGVADFNALGTPTKIVQTPAVTIVLFEAYNHYRQILTDGRPLPVDPQPAWLGYSVGRWDADTFVVETNGLNSVTWLDDGGHPHSDNMRLTERFRRPDFGHMEIEMTINDPEFYTRPWTVTIPKDLVADDELIEFMCENEKDMIHMVGK